MNDLKSIIAFGERLIETGDLDPVYIGLTGLNLSNKTMAKWLIAYWSFYHVGVACFMAERPCIHYWRWMGEAARNTEPSPLGERWPRASERRHFRGEKCVKAIEYISRTSPERWIKAIGTPGDNTAESVMKVIQKWPMFGPWISFKAADMLETCTHRSIAFPDNLGLVYKEPSEAINILAEQEGLSRETMWTRLREHFKTIPAPPLRKRMCGVQEVETICCKWKSSIGGHYWVGKDIHEQRLALKGWGSLAEAMRDAYPTPVCKPETTR